MGYRDVPSGGTPSSGLRGGGIREGSPAPSGPYAGQAFLVPFCGGGLPPFDKRDSPEGAEQDGRANPERRRNTQAKAAQALFAGMTRVGGLRLTDASLRTAPSPACGRGLGRGRSCTQHPRPQETLFASSSSLPGNTPCLPGLQERALRANRGRSPLYGRPLCQAP